MWKSKISPPKHGKSWKKMSKVFLSTVGHWLEPTWRAVFCNTSDTLPTYSLLQVSLRTWGRTVSSILERKNFETEISFMCNVGFVSGGLQPLHYKQLLALYTDVTSLGHAEDEVRNVLFSPPDVPTGEAALPANFFWRTRPPIWRHLLASCSGVFFCDPRIYKLT